jgi:3-hydroxybutyryl-CoA dehydrogenase
MYGITRCGPSRSFPDDHPLLSASVPDATIHILVGAEAGAAYRSLPDKDRYSLVLLELGTECLGVHTDEHRGQEGGNTLGFARFRLGEAQPSELVEIVRQPMTPPGAIGQAVELFARHGLRTAVCADFPGRIVNRLIRPYFNAALARLDSKLATAADLDLTLRLGLGYPEGPIGLLERTGLADHHDVTMALYEALGDLAYWPARRAQVAKARAVEKRPCSP